MDMTEHSRPRILIVDDRQENLTSLAGLLEEMEAETVLASNGREALERLLETEFAVAIIDVHMPEVDGFAVAKFMRGVEETKWIPIIFISAVRKDEQTIFDGYELGAMDYLCKPFHPGILRSKVNVLLDLYRQRKMIQENERELKFFRDMANQLDDEILIFDAQTGRLLDINTAALKRLGLSKEEAIADLKITDCHVILPERDQDWQAFVRKIHQKGRLKVESHHYSQASGQRSWTEANVQYSEFFGRARILVVVRDITQRKQMEEDLWTSKKTAESANLAKGAFLAAMSHDIRTPLNAIMGIGELLEENERDPEKRRFLELSKRAGEGLLALINDILDISKIEAGQLELETVSFNLHALLQQSVDILLLQAQEKKLALTCHLAPDLPPQATGDPQRLRQILLNLIGNAIKFTPRGKVIVAAKKGERDEIHFTVADTGIGIPAEKFPALFQPFTQVDASTTRRFGGSGLGLAICKRLIENMGGRIWVESEFGQGSTFYFTVRLPKAIERLQPIERRRGTPRVTGKPTKSISILLAEDIEENRFVFKAFLRQDPYHLDMVENGKRALEQFQTGKYDVVLMDIEMPVMDGYEATRRIRAWELAQGVAPTPIIALTAHAMRDISKKIHAAGCNVHLSKPVTKARLLDVIAQNTLSA